MEILIHVNPYFIGFLTPSDNAVTDMLAGLIIKGKSPKGAKIEGK